MTRARAAQGFTAGVAMGYFMGRQGRLVLVLRGRFGSIEPIAAAGNPQTGWRIALVPGVENRNEMCAM